MKYSISTFTDLPVPIKAAILIASGASLGTVVTMIPSGSWARLIVLIGFVVIALLLLSYCYLLKRLKKRKAIPMQRDLMKNASATPLVSGSDPKVMAQQDDLRKKFERGIEEFRARDYDFYDIPWYMVVGEPGSGKTEAIRHSNIGFPPGIQDMLQGSGGTINMNWWFTYHAVILDTAGRMMFEQVEEGGGHEWKEFLNLLKKYRQACPINGVLLVIPADSLIRDTADEIGKKADKIARQFDVIQRTLGVRFPVFVVITKSDLINGFRDFFDNITDPQLQHQILGWSNPQPIDEPYRPDFIDQHVKMIKERLHRRRLLLMQQIICGESGVKEKRLADILYTFPQNITRIAPRLARYLELIFRAGSRWSGKPLFFRGIYFTSSMREGSALDWELAETLGVPVDSLPDGRVWERDRAYFLRDLLLKKVFPEEGLVTSATDAKKQHTHRNAVLLAATAASVLFLFVCVFVAQYLYKGSIDKLNNDLKTSAKLLTEDPNKLSKLSLVQADPCKPNKYIIVDNIAKEKLPGNLADAVGNYKTQWMFTPIEWFVGDITDDLYKATEIIYKVSVLKPFLDATCDIMITYKIEDWSNEVNANALLQLIQIQGNKPLSESEDETDSFSRSNFIDNLSKFIIEHGQSNDTKFKTRYDKSELHKPLSRLENEIFNQKWLPSSILKNDPNLDRAMDEAIENGIKLFNQYWQQSHTVQDIKDLKDALEKFKEAEIWMLELTTGSDDTGSEQPTDENQLRQFTDDWTKGFISLKAARVEIERIADPNDSPSLWDLCENAKQKVKEGYDNSLLDELDELDSNSVKENREKLEDGLKKITEELDGFQEDLSQLEEPFWASQGDSRKYKIRFDMYSKVNERLNAEKKSIFDIKTIQEIKQEDEKVLNALDNLPKVSRSGDLFSKAFKHCKDVLNSDKQLRLLSVLEDVPSNIDGIKKFVQDHNSWDWERIKNVEPNRNFDPNGAANVMSSWKYLDGEIDSIFKKQTYNDKKIAFAEYSEDYLNYWLGTLPDKWIDSKIPDPNEETWKTLCEELKNWDHRVDFTELDDFGDYIEDALVKIELPRNEMKEKFDNNLKECTGRYPNECADILNNWAKLSDDALDARRTLLEQTPRDLINQYFPPKVTYRPNSPAEFVYTYWTRLTQNFLKILIHYAKEMSDDQSNNIIPNVYGKKFPLTLDNTKEELGSDEIDKVYSTLENILQHKVYKEGTIGSGDMPRQDVYAELNKLLKNLSEPLVRSNKSINRIWQVLQGLPREQKPYYCKISFVSNPPDDSQIFGSYRWLVVLQKRAEIPFKPIRIEPVTYKGKEVCIVEYGLDNKPIQINFYPYEPNENDIFNSPDEKIGPYEGQWAILHILRKHPDMDGGEVKISLPVPDKDNNDNEITRQLHLKVEFFNDKACENKNRIEGFGQALLSRE